jgi:poly-beta-1,6-N-acetyl-D-glucosamine synthase
MALDLLFPLLDLAYTFILLPCVVLALLGHFWIAGPMTLAVIPLTRLILIAVHRRQLKVFEE